MENRAHAGRPNPTDPTVLHLRSVDTDAASELGLTLRLTRLTDPVTDTFLGVHDRTCPASAHRWADRTH